MTIIARLCALCAVSTLSEALLPDGSGREGVRLIAGLLMLHLVLSQARDLLSMLSGENSLQRVFEIMIQ